MCVVTGHRPCRVCCLCAVCVHHQSRAVSRRRPNVRWSGVVSVRSRDFKQFVRPPYQGKGVFVSCGFSWVPTRAAHGLRRTAG